MTKEWLKQILAGTRKLLKLTEVRPVHAGHFPEVSVKNLFEEFSIRPEVNIYLPEKLPKGKQMDKSYFFNIVNTMCNENSKQSLRMQTLRESLSKRMSRKEKQL